MSQKSQNEISHSSKIEQLLKQETHSHIDVQIHFVQENVDKQLQALQMLNLIAEKYDPLSKHAQIIAVNRNYNNLKNTDYLNENHRKQFQQFDYDLLHNLTPAEENLTTPNTFPQKSDQKSNHSLQSIKQEKKIFA